MKNLFSTRFSSGFTMIELLVVSTILIVLSTIAFTSYGKAGVNARNGKRKADLESVRQALVLYRTDTGSYPVGTNFSTMLSTLSTADYYSSITVEDPKNDATYYYSYSSDGSTFTLQAQLEPDGTVYTAINP